MLSYRCDDCVLWHVVQSVHDDLLHLVAVPGEVRVGGIPAMSATKSKIY